MKMQTLKLDNKKLRELLEWCVDYTLYMKEHSFNEVEINKLKRFSGEKNLRK